MIAGDAAHLMPPFAGEGMCAGLRDAVAMGWRLPAVLRGQLGLGVLKSYESERIAHARHYIQFSQDLGEIICIADPDKAAERDARMMAELAARDYTPISGDLVKLGPGVWCADTPSAGELSPQGVVAFKGREDRFDQAVGVGWFLLGLEAPVAGALRADQEAHLAALGGRALSLGPEGSGFDVVTRDACYASWMRDTGARYAIVRPDFYVAATAQDIESLRASFDTLSHRLGLSS